MLCLMSSYNKRNVFPSGSTINGYQIAVSYRLLRYVVMYDVFIVAHSNWGEASDGAD